LDTLKLVSLSYFGFGFFLLVGLHLLSNPHLLAFPLLAILVGSIPGILGFSQAQRNNLSPTLMGYFGYFWLFFIGVIGTVVLGVIL